MLFKSEGFELCPRPEKKLVEGLCLSYDLLRGQCIETGEACIVLAENAPAEVPRPPEVDPEDAP